MTMTMPSTPWRALVCYFEGRDVSTTQVGSRPLHFFPTRKAPQNSGSHVETPPPPKKKKKTFI